MNTINFMQFCRLCANRKDVTSTLINLDTNKLMLDKLNTVAPRILENDNALPRGICTKCAAQLIEAYKFVNNCFKAQETLKQHLKQIQSEEILRESSVNSVEDSVTTLKQNKTDCSVITIEDCNDTELFEFINVEQLPREMEENEMNLNENKEMVKYEDESNNFDSEFNLETDMIIKVDENYDLEFKNYIIDNRNKIIDQAHPESSQTSHKCEICDRVFRYSSDLQIHLTTHNKRSYKCDLCETRFISESYLKVHRVRVHTKERLYQCELCDKAYIYKSNLKNHLLLHTKTTSYTCEICDKTFALKDYLKAHVLKHVNKEGCKCKICGRVFRQYLKLELHKRMHASDKSYECQICNRAFTDFENLKVHLRSHTNEKQHTCKICGRDFDTNENLNEHKLVHRAVLSNFSPRGEM